MYKLSDKTSLKIAKYARQFIVKFLTFILLVGFAYVILYPFLFEILSAFMSSEDLYNPLVDIIPMDWSLNNITYVLKETDFLSGLGNSLLYAVLVAILTTASSAVIGYGIAKFRFKGVNILTFIIIVIMLMPIQTLTIPVYLNFRFFDFAGITSLFGIKGINLLSTPWSLIIMSATGFSFRAGIFIILMRQYYIGVPNELTEAAYVDGAGPFKTFLIIILPMARSMLVVVFSLSFAWQYTDTFYSNLLLSDIKMLPSVVSLLSQSVWSDANYYLNYIRGSTAGIMAIFPLIIFYCVLQKQIIQGIERSGLVG